MGKLTLAAGLVLGVATWFLLFVILGIGLGTAFIAGGCVLAGGVLAGGMVSLGLIGSTAVSPAPLRGILDAPLTAPGLIVGITSFIVLEVVLSVPMWVGVVTGLSVMGLYNVTEAAGRSRHLTAAGIESTTARQTAPASVHASVANGRDQEVRDQVLSR